MPGVNIVLENTTMGAATDLNGNYDIENVPVGEYTVVATFIGYARLRIEDVHIKANQSETVNLKMSMEALEGEEVVVTAKALKNTEAVLLKDRQKAAAVSDAISAEVISQAGASDAADAMKQVTGASVVDGKYVYIRGLGDRYTSTQLNGAEIPSADPYRRAGSVDIIPSNLIDNIVTVKSFTPDRPGDFSGGMVDIKTKDFPDQLNFKFSVSGSYNTQATFNSNGPIGYTGGSTDWLGYDDGSRSIPGIVDAGLKSGDYPTPPTSFNPESTESLDDLQVYSQAFNPQMAPSPMTPSLNQSYSLSIGNEFDLFNRSLGYLASLTYSNGYESYDDGIYNAWRLGSSQATELTPIFRMADVQSTHNVLWGGLLKSSYKINPFNIISANYLYNTNGVSVARNLQGQYDYDKLDAADDLFIASNLGYSERQLASLQLNGDHHFMSLGGLKMDWNVTTSATRQDEPDLRYFSRYAMVEDGEIIRQGTFSNIAPTRYFRTLNESKNEIGANFTLPFRQWSGKAANLKFGGLYSQKERDFVENRFVYNEGSGARSFKGDADAFFASDNIGWDMTSQTINGTTYYGYKLKLSLSPADLRVNDYGAEQEILAYYAMAELPLSNKLRFIGGARYEATNINMASLDTTKADGKIDTKDWLPSVNFIYTIHPDMNVRASMTRTLARPNFRELAPYASYDFSAGFTHIGNPLLQRTLIDNYDLRWEWFTRPGEIYGLSFFYKSFQNPIERAFIVTSSNREITWENVDRAIVLGMEVELRKKLDLLSSRLSNLSFGTNFSLVQSRIEITEEQLALMRQNNPEMESTRPLEGQSPFLLNLNMTYDNAENGLSAHVYYNVFGERLSEWNKTGEPFVYEQPAHTLNASVYYRVGDNIKLKFAGKNLLNAKRQKTQLYQGTDYIFTQFTEGTTFSIGLDYSL
ncbi:TonB-dependent receptor [candidate division KSB1 bacterium]|nr:TonB-dependent receptor [candidate division KSB1 bacterium]